jgi:hypothetical protein
LRARLAAVAAGILVVAGTGVLLAPIAEASSTLAVTTSSLPGVEVDEPLGIQLTASGGNPPYQWVPDALPPGVTITSGGLIGGSATTAGLQEVAVSVVDANNARVNAQFKFLVGPGPAITTGSLPSGVQGSPYSVNLQASGGTPPYVWSIGKGGVPGGLVLTSYGLLSGLPGAVGPTTIDVELTDLSGANVQATFTFTILPPPLPAEGYVTLNAAGQSAAVGVGAPSATGRLPGKSAGIAVEASGGGYWVVNTAGRVHAFGDAHFYGQIARRDLHGTVVGIAALPDGSGYWLATSTGHVYGFGGAHALSDLTLRRGQGQIVAVAAATTGAGYWLVTGSGHVFGFGTATTAGSVPKRALRGHVVAIAASTSGSGYLVATSTGRVYGFGGARPLRPNAGPAVGAVIGIALDQPPAAVGYWLLTRSGAVYSYGHAREIATSPPQPISTALSVVPAVAIGSGR